MSIFSKMFSLPGLIGAGVGGVAGHFLGGATAEGGPNIMAIALGAGGGALLAGMLFGSSEETHEEEPEVEQPRVPMRPRPRAAAR